MLFNRTRFLISRLTLLKRGIQESPHLKQISYVQGQSPEPNIREYFYYIDHQGMLFLDDSKMKNFTSCFKEKKFLEFFFSRIRVNDTGRYEDFFPYISPCGRESNYIKCDDVPFVFTHVVNLEDGDGQKQQFLSYGHAGNLLIEKFQPDNICMLPDTERIYHPAPERVGGIGLIKSSLAIEFSKFFEFHNKESNMPTHFNWEGNKYVLSNVLLDKMKGRN